MQTNQYRCDDLASDLESLQADDRHSFAETYLLRASVATLDNAKCSSTTPDVVREYNNKKGQQ
jgi:hypothetical protein